MDVIESEAALEACIGKTSSAIHLKVIDHLDPAALRWIAASPLVFAGFGDAGHSAITLAGGARGFISRPCRASFPIPLDAIDDPALAKPGMGFGGLFLAPGIGETLRVNGRVAAVTGSAIEIVVAECYVHCAKALIRSDFWQAAPCEGPSDPAAMIAASRFMALATVDREGHADMSPKGDPAGAMVRMVGDGLVFAERPGNRRADSYRNILAQPHLAAALLVPGSAQVLTISGRARISSDRALRESFAVRGKLPLLATIVEQPAMTFRPSAALARAALWPLSEPAATIDPAATFIAHMKLNKERGLQARVLGAAAAIPGVMQKGLDLDYKRNLY